MNNFNIDSPLSFGEQQEIKKLVNDAGVYSSKIITCFEAVAAMLTLAGMYLLTLADPLGFALGALGCLAWLVVALLNKLYFLAALNVALFIINLSGAL